MVVRKKVAASTQSQALNALVFLYDKVLEKPFGELGHFAHSKRPQRLPVVLSRSEVNHLLDGLDGIRQLMAGLLYGSGLRLMQLAVCVSQWALVGRPAKRQDPAASYSRKWLAKEGQEGGERGGDYQEG